MHSDLVRNFYNDLKFPGYYSMEDFEFYNVEGIHNIYLREIDNNLAHGLEILDVGCGTGFVSNLFASIYKSNFTAVDFADSIDYAENFSKQNQINNVDWIKQDFLKFIEHKQYDIIICCGVLHHMPEYQTALDKMKSMLKPGGKLLLGLYNPWGKFLKKFCQLNYHNDTLYRDQEHNPFELSFSYKQVLQLCDDLKFNTVNPSYCNKFVDLRALFNSYNGGLALYVFEKPIWKKQ